MNYSVRSTRHRDSVVVIFVMNIMYDTNFLYPCTYLN